MNSQSSSAVAKSCPPDWHVAQDIHDGTYYCAPAHPDSAIAQGLAMPIVIVLAVVLGAAIRWDRARRRKP
jgi:hypothetical protein